VTSPSIDAIQGVISDLDAQIEKRSKSIELFKQSRRDVQYTLMGHLETDLAKLKADRDRWVARLPQKVA